MASDLEQRLGEVGRLRADQADQSFFSTAAAYGGKVRKLQTLHLNITKEQALKFCTVFLRVGFQCFLCSVLVWER